MSSEVPPDGLSERQLLKWFADAEATKERIERKRRMECTASKTKEKTRSNQRREKLKEEKKLSKRKMAERRNAKKKET